MTEAQLIQKPRRHPGSVTMSDEEYRQLYVIIRDRFGIDLHPAKRDLIPRRLSPRLKQLQIFSFSEYIERLNLHWEQEVEFFANAITTNLTSFFREHHHFDFIANEFVDEIAKKKRMERKLRVWSAACSSGEEPYSIAMVLNAKRPQLNGFDTKILATDLDTQVLRTAMSGEYPKERVSAVPEQYRKDAFDELNKDTVAIKPVLKEMIAFRKLNFFDNWPMSNAFDLIVCRNALIYFDLETQASLLKKFANQQKSGDYLIVGHSESLEGIAPDYTLIGKTIYRRR